MSDAFKLSPQQKRLWFLQQDKTAYRAQCEIAIDGALDVELLKNVVQQIVERHEILRTTFQRQPGIRTPVQVIGDANASWQNQDDIAFDFESGPLLRLTLTRLSASQHTLLVSLPALCADASTLKCFYDELCRTYDAQPISGDAMQYADFAAWQNELLESEAATAGAEFWQQRAIPQLAAGSNSFTAARAISNEFIPARFACDVDPSLAEQLARFARAHQSDHSTVLQSCWLALLWRLTQQSEIVLGRVFDGRNYDELAGAFGMMSRCVPVKARLDHDPSFLELLHETARDVQETEQWQEFWTWPGDGRTEYLPLSFEYQSCAGSYQARDVRFSVRDQFTCFERFNLKLVTRDHESALHIELHYDARAIAVDAVRCIADQFLELLASALENPQARLSELRILSVNERRRLVVELNETTRDYARDYDCHALVHQLFEQQVAGAPERIAVVSDEARISYADLNARANQLAHYLQKLGVAPETAVVLNVERSIDTLIGLLAILKAGGAYVPLEGAQPGHRLAAILEETKAPVVITQAGLRDQFTSDKQRVICIDLDWPTIAGENSTDLHVDLSPANVVYIVYTSGSTGRPKGVAVEHRQVANYLHAINEKIGFVPHAGYAIVSTFAADLGNTMIFPALCTGGTLHVLTKQRATDATSLAEYFAGHEIDYLKIVPSHLEALLAHEQAPALLPRRCLIVGGEAAGPDLLDLVKELAPQCEIYNHYGPTETAVGILTNKLEDSYSQSPPLGRPLANNNVYLLDKRMQPVAVGEIGEIYLGGAQVSRGYISQASATAERFVPHPFAQRGGERLYRTGDLGRFLPDGKIEFAGRVDSQVKLHGYRIELGEVRYALNQHSQISDSVAVIHRDENQQDVLIAYYIASQDIDLDELRTFLTEYLGSHAIPNFFHRLVRFPLNANGKIDLHALASNGTATRSATRKGSPPATPMEELLAGLWMKLLNVKQISTDDNFFTLGGHSLLATRIVSQLHKVLQVEVPFTVLFEAPTLGGTAKRLEALVKQRQGLQTPPLVRVPRDRELPLSFAQQRLWFLDQLQPNSSGYNNASALRLSGSLNVNALEKTLNEIIRRHEILRTSFRTTRGNAVQVIAPHVPVKLPFTDLSHANEAEAFRLINNDSGRPFDLASGPLWRVKLFRLAPEEHLLAVTMHHIVTDAWSNSVFMQEASALYKAFLRDEPSPLAELPVQYADFAAWQHQLLAGEQLERHLVYWRRRLSGPLPMLELPGDRPRPEVRTFHGAKQTIAFSRELTDELRAFSQQRGVTLFMTLVAAFNVLLRYHTTQDDVVVGTDVANRNYADTEGLIGFFVNQLVLRTDLSGDPTIDELLDRVREVTLGAYTHQDLPFDRLVEALKPERNLKYAPFFEVKLVLENTSPAVLELPGLTIESLDVDTIEAKLDLILVLRERQEGLQGWFEYNRDLFNPATVIRFGEQLEVLLRRILSAPGDRLSELQQALAAFDRERHEREQQRSEKAWRQSFKTIKPQPISISGTDTV